MKEGKERNAEVQEGSKTQENEYLRLLRDLETQIEHGDNVNGGDRNSEATKEEGRAECMATKQGSETVGVNRAPSVKRGLEKNMRPVAKFLSQYRSQR